MHLQSQASAHTFTHACRHTNTHTNTHRVKICTHIMQTRANTYTNLILRSLEPCISGSQTTEINTIKMQKASHKLAHDYISGAPLNEQRRCMCVLCLLLCDRHASKVNKKISQNAQSLLDPWSEVSTLDFW